MIKQFGVYSYSHSLVVVLTNTVFNDVESVLIAPIKSAVGKCLIKDLHIACNVNSDDCYIDLLDIATVTKRHLKSIPNNDLSKMRESIKQGIDLLIDGF